MFKFIKIFLILILVLILIVVFFRHSLCRLLIVKATTKATGLKLSIEELNLDILSSTLTMRGIILFNPPGFKDELLSKVKEISIRYELPDCLSGRLHFREAKVKVEEINIIRNENRDSNVTAFKKDKFKAKTSKYIAPASVTQEVPQTIKKRRPKFLIDRLEVSLEKATFKDYKARIGEPAVIIFSAKGPFVFTNVSDLRGVVHSVSAKGGFRALLSNLVGILPADALQTTKELIQKKIKDVLIDKVR